MGFDHSHRRSSLRMLDGNYPQRTSLCLRDVSKTLASQAKAIKRKKDLSCPLPAIGLCCHVSFNYMLPVG